MLQQPLARRVAGAARYAAAGEALPGALPLSSMRRRAAPGRVRFFQALSMSASSLRDSWMPVFFFGHKTRRSSSSSQRVENRPKLAR